MVQVIQAIELGDDGLEKAGTDAAINAKPQRSLPD
jgi:hypothetical protein